MLKWDVNRREFLKIAAGAGSLRLVTKSRLSERNRQSLSGRFSVPIVPESRRDFVCS